jgi:hypothetical protein
MFWKEQARKAATSLDLLYKFEIIEIAEIYVAETRAISFFVKYRIFVYVILQSS